MIRIKTYRDDKRGDKVAVKMWGTLGTVLQESKTLIEAITEMIRAHVQDNVEKDKTLFEYATILRDAQREIERELAADLSEEDPAGDQPEE